MRRSCGKILTGLVGLLALSACSTGEQSSNDPVAAVSPSVPAVPGPHGRAASLPIEDSVYPEYGDDRIDTLHQEVDLTWDPDDSLLTGRQRVVFRAARDADEFVLDLTTDLHVERARVDGAAVTTEHDDHVLTVEHPIEKDGQYVLILRYSGTPQPVEAPTKRTDLKRVGFTINPDGQVWTMQAPYGAHTWYAVNDQPADKAMYTVRLSVPQPWVGVSNGRLTSRSNAGGKSVTTFELDEPASSYLMTLAFGPYQRTEVPAVDGTPLTFWTPPNRPGLVKRLNVARDGLRWLEKRLGPYPFDTLGFVIVPGRSGMETQTMITLSDGPGAASPEVVIHEMAHQWWGDQVTPCDWRDVWMNEGMATYLQMLWMDEDQGLAEGDTLAEWSSINDSTRQDYGPPGDYDPDAFGSGNVYSPPAAMWDALREQLGDDVFWRLVRDWPAAHDTTCATREQLVQWWSEESGEDLASFFDAWLLGATDPD